MMDRNELIYGDFIPDALKLEIAELIYSKFEEINYMPKCYTSLAQAVLDEADGRVQRGIEDLPNRSVDSKVMFLMRITISRIKGLIQVNGEWEPEYAYKVLAARLQKEIDTNGEN